MTSRVVSEETEDTLASALETVRIALALGASIPAVPGMQIYHATLVLDRQYTSDLGAYGCKEDALAAVRNWVIAEWENGYNAPWADDVEIDFYDTAEYQTERDEWLDGRTDEEIVEEYFSGTDEDHYSIDLIQVRPCP